MDSIDDAFYQENKSNVGLDEPSMEINPWEILLYSPIWVPCMAFDYITEKLGCDIFLAEGAMDFLRYRLGLRITTKK